MNMFSLLKVKNDRKSRHSQCLFSRILKMISFIFAIVVLSTCINKDIAFAKTLDEIIQYRITADVCEDASVDFTYDISWKVLDSKSEGPLEWVQIGIPNSHYNDIVPLSDTISRISTKNSGGTYAVVYFDRKYYKDEIVNFSFKVNMDYMYQVYPEEDVVEYTFTPGWFDNIAVDELTIRWNSDKITKFEPAKCFMDGGYHEWTASLSPGEKYTVEVTYPSDAFAFDLSKHETSSDDDGYDFSEHNVFQNTLFIIFVIIFCIIIVAVCCLPVIVPIIIVYVIYTAARGFTTKNDKKITRTIIEYYASCPSCGGSREEGKEKCSYCGTNMVKSKQEIKEEEIPTTDKKILDYDKDGEYRFSDNPNRYVRVHVVSVPHVYHTPTRVSSSSGRSHHSSCAHSSCACACACACAGGGRAGCSTKDFYNTNLKMRFLEKYKK